MVSALSAAPASPSELSEADLRALVARFGSPLLVLDCDQIRRQYHDLRAALPGVDLRMTALSVGDTCAW